ncbi:MAG: diphosphomevalonate decarboxylase [Flavobacterium sp.]
MKYDFLGWVPEILPESFNAKASAPSNIALVKYWGKKASQIPANPSISFTLNHCKTITEITFLKKDNPNDFSFDFWFEGAAKPDFHPKIQQFLERIERYVPVLKCYQLTIKSENTFPHSSGIASSASAMAAMSAVIISFEKTLCINKSEDFWLAKASFLARLGSGSACRSIQGPLMIWGESEMESTSDEFAVVHDAIHPIFQDFQDTILLVDKGEKQVSSTLGHGLMNGHPFAENRFAQAHQNLKSITQAMQEGDLETFIALVESEALTLHAMMMTSQPYFILMKPNTLRVIEEIWNFRKETNIPVCFTLDAGANVHVLYPKQNQPEVLTFIKHTLAAYCQNNQYICDKIGSGIEYL